ncbi:MAG TPA: hypothetical protein VF458_01935 [Ktedonobacteraceae bacterium]
MTVKLNESAFEQAKQLIEQGKCVTDEKDRWSEHHPSTKEENAYLKAHGIKEYGKWFLGIDTDEDEDNKGRYKFPYSDFVKVHRCGVLSAESRAGQYHYADIERAAAHLHGMLEGATL